MGYYVEAERKRAEEIRRRLLKENVYDKTRKTRHREGKVYFPVIEKTSGFINKKMASIPVETKPASLHEALRGRVDEDVITAVPSSYDLIGDIAVIDLQPEIGQQWNLVGEALMRASPNVKTVAVKTTPVSTDYRTRRVEVVAGEEKTAAIHKEHGLQIMVDVEKTYFSPRSSGERKRVTDQINSDERVLVLFAGVGPYALLAAKKTLKPVTAVELNPDAVEYMKENTRLNKLELNIIEGDARTETTKHGAFDRIIMPLPKNSRDFLEPALKALKPGGVIHYYTFNKDNSSAEKEVTELCEKHGYQVEILDSVVCGSFNPAISRICVDFKAVKY